jgi:hypothetical protein
MDTPRYIPTWKAVTNNSNLERFLGYAGDLDIYTELIAGEPVLLVVGPNHRRARPNGTHNFDQYEVVDERSIERYDAHDAIDVPLTPYDMCLIYTLAAANGLINEDLNAS